MKDNFISNIFNNPDTHIIIKILFVLIGLIVAGLVYQMGKELGRSVVNAAFEIFRSFS